MPLQLLVQLVYWLKADQLAVQHRAGQAEHQEAASEISRILAALAARPVAQRIMVAAAALLDLTGVVRLAALVMRRHLYQAAEAAARTDLAAQ
jgi:hypothetical protein